LMKLNKQIEECRTNRSKQLDFNINGMGLINLYSRFRIFYNDDFIFNAENKNDNKGVRIILGGSHEPTGGV